MATEKRSDVELRASLIAAARRLMAGQDNFSLKQLYAESGLGRAVFYRCFASKEALLADLVGGDARMLGDLAEAMAPAETVKVAAAGGGHAMLAAPPVDAWLERRLRVFERALAALESRQDKSEREWSRGLSLLEEKFEGLAPETLVWEAAAAPQAPAQDAPDDEIVFAPLEAAEATPKPQSAQSEEPISAQEVDDFIARARVAAQRAVQPPPPPRPTVLPRWIAWMGVVTVTLLVCVGLALGNVARATQTMPVGGIAYRSEPHDGVGRLMALADSGEARAQTLLALAYLRGQYGLKDDSAAMRWSLAAAEQGVPMAQYLAGVLYQQKDAARAFSWLQEAALRGNIKAMHNLAIAYIQGLGVAEDEKRAAAWFGRAASQGYLDSQFDLAVLFERGQGVAPNRYAALKWYLIAAARGDGPAKARAAQLRAEMPADEITRAVAAASSFTPLPHDQFANAVMSP